MFLIAAVICFIIALLGQVDAFTGVNVLAFTIGGLLALALEQLLGGFVALPIRRPPPQQ